jgi:hypothetical protein
MFGLLERFAPAVGSRLAVEMWCTPPVMDASLNMSPGVVAGHRVISFDLPSHNDSGPGALALGRTAIVECARAVEAFVDT